MKDIQKIKEFFSKPLNEESTTFKVGDKVTYLGHPAEITKVNKEMTGAITYSVSYDKGTGKTKATNIYNKDGEIKSLNEATEEDPVDTITMDIPLFLRMLEYAKEDAQEDMDLHDVTEKANILGKEKGILSMEDYDAIVGAAEEIKEGMGNEIGDKVYFRGDMGEKYPSSQGYYGIIEDTTPSRNYNMLATYDVVVYDKNDNEIRTITTDWTNLTNKKVNEASDYFKRRKAQDDYAVSKQDKPKKPYNPNPSGKTDYMKRREKDLAEVILAKLKK